MGRRAGRDAARIGIVTQKSYGLPNEVRAPKIGAALRAAGLEVCLFVPSGAPPGLSDVAALDQSRRFGWLPRALRIPLPGNPVWSWWLEAEVRERALNLLIGRDLRLAHATLRAGRRAGIPVILDLAEPFEHMVAEAGIQHPGHLLLRRPTLVRRIEASAARAADRVWVVVQESADRLARLGVAPERVSVVGNTPDLAAWASVLASGANRRPEHYAAERKLVYVGVLSAIRGLDSLVRDVVQLTRTSELSLTLVVVGDGPERRRLEALVRSLRAERQVSFTGWVSHEEVRRQLDGGVVGVIPHRVVPLTETTVPNKLFEYMAAAVPILATPMGPVARVLAGTGAGWCAGPGEWQAKLRWIASAPADELWMAGQRGRRAVLERYNWSVDAEVVVRDVLGLVGKPTGRTLPQ